uniref:Uncharacterized protein n=1 Tax=Globodera rostochiensis TaxID=31243 RepID=A0A914IAA8_GLORO
MTTTSSPNTTADVRVLSPTGAQPVSELSDQMQQFCVDDGVETEQHQQQTISPTPSESGFCVVTSPTTNDYIGLGNDSVADSLLNDQPSQQLQPTTIARRPTGKKKLFAFGKKRKEKATTVPKRENVQNAISDRGSM